MNLPKEELNAALEKISVEWLLDQEGLDYRTSHGTRGLQLNLRECPACHETGYKTYINAETGLGNCFHGSCNFKFNRFKLIRAITGLSGDRFDAYVVEQARMQGWLPKPTAKPMLIKGNLQLPTKTIMLPHEGKMLPYLLQRGINGNLAEHFGLGFCSKGWWGYKLSDGAERWVSYDQRVIIPIADLDKNMVSFQGRDMTGEKLPKYLFPVGFAVAGSHLYHGWSFVPGVTTHAVVGEGAFDVFSIYKALTMPNIMAVGTFGMHLSDGPDGQIAKFARLKAQGLDTVTMMWDGEGRAQKAAVKAGLQLMQIGLKVRIAKLPDGKDPNDLDITQVQRAYFEARALTRLSAITISMEAAMG